MSDITFSASMDEKDVQRALQNMVKENAKLRAEIGMGVQEAKAAAAQEREWQKLREKATKDATQQMQQLNASAQRIKDSVATPFEEAKKKVSELREHLQAGRLTVEEYRAAYALVGKELKEATRDHAAEAAAAKAAAELKAEASKKAAEAERAHTQAVKEATAVADKYATKEEKVAAELRRLNALKEKGVLSSKDHARAVDAENAKLQESSSAMATFSGSLQTMAGVGTAAAGALGQISGKLLELQKEMAATTVDWDKMSRKFGVQGGLSEKDRVAQSREVGQVAFDAAVPIDKAFETATQLSSSGFADPVNGGALNTALGLIQSSNQIEGNAAEFIKGSGQFMSAFGMKKDQGNLADLGIRMQGLFKSTDVQASDLPEFAKAAPVLSGAGLNLEESLSTLTALREKMAPGEAATGARNVVSMMQTAGVNKTSTEALASVGLTPQQVDIEGEGLRAALETLKAATSQLGEAERAIVMTKVFGRENMAAASILMDSTGKMGEYDQMQRAAGKNFQKDVATQRTGAAADKTRAEVSATMETVKYEDEIREQELSRQARVSLREKKQKAEANKGTIGGRLNAGIIGLGGAVDDYMYHPIAGESDMGVAHAREKERLAGRDAAQFTRGIAVPAALLDAAPAKQGPALNQQQVGQLQGKAIQQKDIERSAEESAELQKRIKDLRGGIADPKVKKEVGSILNDANKGRGVLTLEEQVKSVQNKSDGLVSQAVKGGFDLKNAPPEVRKQLAENSETVATLKSIADLMRQQIALQNAQVDQGKAKTHAGLVAGRAQQEGRQ